MPRFGGDQYRIFQGFSEYYGLGPHVAQRLLPLELEQLEGGVAEDNDQGEGYRYGHFREYGAGQKTHRSHLCRVVPGILYRLEAQGSRNTVQSQL